MSYSELKENELKSLLNAAENKEKNKTRKILVFLVVFALDFALCVFTTGIHQAIGNHKER